MVYGLGSASSSESDWSEEDRAYELEDEYQNVFLLDGTLVTEYVHESWFVEHYSRLLEATPNWRAEWFESEVLKPHCWTLRFENAGV